MILYGRLKTYEAIVKGESIPKPGIPESFRVLTKELQSLALDIKLYKQDEQIEMKESVEDDNDSIVPNLEDTTSLVTEEDFRGMSVEEDGELTNEELDTGTSDDYESDSYSDDDE